MQNLSPTLQLLLARFDGQVLIPFVPGSKSVGIAEQTARNRLSKGTYPIKTELRGARRFIHISDLARYVDSSYEESTKRKRGPQTKASKIQAKTGGGAQ